ncbi:MAG: Aspartyl-tRNA(Asn) amidotransferase subunit Glutamyl-tRNA(Gln) amidotransferase subunit [Geminicoccaceae bacterium]|jgi:Asp-tRNA(Asn)/Glu-tRNA(Gln) amidotransferase A subunit family amidase|nr:Aspartyl-tRNA(Asn) amidotransferase subunit Glutamyl-tRNA(Gln) amidotransferase subunit [Geminicoccaceae bacterium]
MAVRANELSACAALAELAAGRLSAEGLTRACLERIGEREPIVRAFAHLDPALALAEARRRDRDARHGPLFGLPFGVKDLVDTADRPTAYGSQIYAGNRPAQDAACVALARAAGAVILGKTVTTEFALSAPGPTTNPHDPARTPGGSSSGSAAAVADRMVPVAFGTQTGGSIIRPASYCGVVGYKPSLGVINRTGVKPLAESFDTVGLFARSVADVALVAGVLAGEDPARCHAPPLRPARVGLCRTPFWDEAEPASRQALATAADVLRREGVTIDEIALPAAFDDLNECQSSVLRFEAYRTFAYERTVHAARLADSTRAEFEAGARITRRDYLDAKDAIRECRRLIADLFERVDMLLAPSAPGAAPPGLASTGEATFNRVWTGLLTPCLNLPGLTDPNGLPVGVQTVGARNDDIRLLCWSRWLEPRLARG